MYNRLEKNFVDEMLDALLHGIAVFAAFHFFLSQGKNYAELSSLEFLLAALFQFFWRTDTLWKVTLEFKSLQHHTLSR